MAYSEYEGGYWWASYNDWSWVIKPFYRAREDPKLWRNWIRATECSCALAIKMSRAKANSGIHGGLIKSKKHRKKAKENTKTAK